MRFWQMLVGATLTTQLVRHSLRYSDSFWRWQIAEVLSIAGAAATWWLFARMWPDRPDFIAPSKPTAAGNDLVQHARNLGEL